MPNANLAETGSTASCPTAAAYIAMNEANGMCILIAGSSAAHIRSSEVVFVSLFE